MTELNPVFLAWQSPETRSWHVVGALTETSNGYEFYYTKGVLNATNFIPFSGMADLKKSYVSDMLFPLFHNRLLSSKRPEYPQFIKWLGLKNENASSLNILARSGGTRETDKLQMFRRIEIKNTGEFEHFFFLHAVRYLTKTAQKRIDSLTMGERLFLCLDYQNEHDSNAVIVRADNPAEIVGYCPRYLAKDINTLLLNSTTLTVSVEKISTSAPTNYRLMCRINGQLNAGIKNPLSEQEEYLFTTE